MNTTIQELTQSLRTGTRSLHDYLAALERQFDNREANTFAFLPETRRWERLAKDADALLTRFPDPAKRPPLFGLPIGVKDIFHVDGLPTRAGSRLTPDVLAGDESIVVTRLKELGALILGKTVTTEFAWFGPGPTRNPHNPAHTPGGSSSGSAAAVAAGLTPLTLGTQTIGSINRPAAFCGVVGYKPSYDLFSREGVIPLSESVDHVGYFTRTVADAAFVWERLADEWRMGDGEWEMRQPVLGIPVGKYLESATPEGLAHFWEWVERLRDAGYMVKEIEMLADFERIYHHHYALVSVDAANYHAKFKKHSHLYHLQTFNLVGEARLIDAETYQAARASRLELRERLENAMDEHGIDLWLSPPATGPAPEGIDSTGSPIMNLPWTHAGMPTLSIPAGVSGERRLPMGLQLAGRFGLDAALFEHGLFVERTIVA